MMNDAPFLGLNPFSEKDGPFFFGRDRQKRSLVRSLKVSRLTVLIGESGAGKSSILQAGVAPMLRREAEQNQHKYGEPQWAVIVFKDWHNKNPLQCLLAQIQAVIADTLGLDPTDLQPGVDSVETLREWTKKLGGDGGSGRLFLILDQFEEYFRFHPLDSGEHSFANEFIRWVNSSDLRVNFLLSLRQDAFSELHRFKQDILNIFDNSVVLAPLGRSSAQEAIVKPIGEYNLRKILSSHLKISPITVLSAGKGQGKSRALSAIADILSNVIIFQSWRGDPATELVQQVEKSFKVLYPDFSVSESHKTLANILTAWSAYRSNEENSKPLFLIFDQFEEFFQYQPPALGEGSFVAELARVVNDEHLSSVHVLISIREDAEHLLKHFDEHIPNIYDDVLRIKKTTEPSTISALVDPIEESRQYSFKAINIEPELVEEVLNQLSILSFENLSEFIPGKMGDVETLGNKGKISAPFLQLVMKFIWDKEAEYGSQCLRLKTLNDQGGVSKIAETHLNQTMETFSEDQQELLAQVFQYLVTPSGGKQIYALQDLAEYTQCEASRLADLLEILADQNHRIVRPVEEERYTIFHDVLAQPILDWSRRFLERAEIQKAMQQQRSRWQKRAIKFAGVTAFSTAVVVGGIMGLWGIAKRQQAIGAGEQRLAGLEAIQQAETGSQLEALLNTMAVAQTVRRGNLQSAKPSTNLALQQILSSIQEQNRFSATSGDFLTASQSILSDSGDLAAIASLDGQITLWNISDGKRLPGFQAHQGPIIKFQFLADQNRLATAGLDGTATIWDREGNPIKTFQAPNDIGWIVGFSADGNRLAASSLDGTLTVWSFQGEKLASFSNAHDGWILNANFSADGQLLATTGGATVKLWTISEPALLREYTPEGSTFFVEFSQDGEYLITAGEEGRIIRWSIETGQKVDAQNTQQGPIYFLGGRSDSKPLSEVPAESTIWATASSNGMVSLWDSQGNRLSSLRGHDNVVQGIGFGPNRQVTTVTQNGTVRQWQLQSQSGFPAYETLLFRAQVKYSPDGQSLITTAERGIKQWPLPGEHEHQTPTIASAGIGMGSRFDAEDNLWFVATTQDGQTAFVQTTLQKASPVSFQSTLGRFWYADLSPDLKWLATTSSDGAEGIAQIWDLQNPDHPPRELSHPVQTFIASVAFSPDGQHLATTTLDGSVYLWAMAKLEQPPRSFQVEGSYVTDLEFNADGTQLAIALADNSVQLRDTLGGLIQIFRGHKAQVRSVHFSPDGQWLLTSSLDGTARLWDMEGNQWAEYQGRDNSGVLDAAFSPDGRQIATITLDGFVQTWPVKDFDQLVTQGCDWLDDFLKIHSEEQKALSEICPP